MPRIIRKVTPEGVSWGSMLQHWRLIEADLHDVYGVDVDDDEFLRRRSWRWLRVRITGLLELPPTYLLVGQRMVVVPSTRFGYAMNPPKFEG